MVYYIDEKLYVVLFPLMNKFVETNQHTKEFKTALKISLDAVG